MPISWILIPCFVLSVIFLMLKLVLQAISKEEETNAVIPGYPSLISKLRNFEYPDATYRFPAEGVVNYKISQLNDEERAAIKTANVSLEVQDMSDVALYKIISTEVLVNNPRLLTSMNHPNYVEVIRHYDTTTESFDDESYRAKALSIVKSAFPDIDVATIDNQGLYTRLMG